MKKVCRLLPCSGVALALILTGFAAQAQLQINSSPNVVGSGARALGMGGAFIAIADDATAASWNPGGLTQLERPEISLVYDFDWRSEEFRSWSHPEMNSDHDVSFNDLNYFSVVYPIRRTIGGRNLVLSLNYQRMYDFDRDIKLRFADFAGLPFGNIVDFTSRLRYSQRGQLGAISPAFGMEITNRLSAGVVMNIYDQSLLPDNEWKVRQEERRNVRLNGALLSVGRLNVERNYDDFEGINYTFGMLYRATERLQFGLVYHTKFTADVTYSEVVRAAFSGAPPGITRARRKQEYVFPSAIGLGVAYRFPNDKLTLSLDVTRRDWDQFVIHDPQNRSLSLQRISGITGLPKDISPHDPTYTVRMGMEYVFVNDKKPKQEWLPSLRAGLFYDPEPAGGRRDEWFGLGKVTGKPDDYYGFSLGAGVLIKNRVNIDAAYVYRWGDGVRNDTFGLAGTKAGVDQHTFYLSTVIYF